MYYDNSNIENTVNAVKQAIFVDYGITLQMAVLTNTLYSQPTLEIRWEEGEEKFQTSKILSNYPTVGSPKYAWRDTAKRIANELRQNIRDARTRRARQWESTTPSASEVPMAFMDPRKDLPGTDVYEQPATVNESFKCDNTPKTLLLCIPQNK